MVVGESLSKRHWLFNLHSKNGCSQSDYDYKRNEVDPRVELCSIDADFSFRNAA